MNSSVDKRPGYRIVRRTVGAYAAFDRKLERGMRAARDAVQGLLNAALSPDERTDLTVYLYGLDFQQRHRSRVALWPWEESWFRRALPKPPARVLLGAAGCGREATALRGAGFEVAAFEPVARDLPALTQAVGDESEVALGSYEDFVKATRCPDDSPLSRLASRRYDAVLLGWSSLTHVCTLEARHDLLRTCARLCPEGPILASFWFTANGGTPPGRAERAGAALGAVLARLRHAGQSPNLASASDLFTTHCGFAHVFTRAELEELAATCGRALQLELDGFPHATFVR